VARNEFVHSPSLPIQTRGARRPFQSATIHGAVQSSQLRSRQSVIDDCQAVSFHHRFHVGTPQNVFQRFVGKMLLSLKYRGNSPTDARSGPHHAFQKAATVDAVGIVIVSDFFRHG